MIRSPHRETGFTMIEVLVALIVLAIGLLGVAGVQTLAMKQTTNSHVRSQVSILAYDMVERIRANLPGAEGGEYSNITAAPTAPSCTTCTPAQVADLDASQWYASLDDAIPGFTGATVSFANGVATITINWTERDLGNDSVAQTYELDARVLQ